MPELCTLLMCAVLLQENQDSSGCIQGDRARAQEQNMHCTGTLRDAPACSPSFAAKP